MLKCTTFLGVPMGRKPKIFIHVTEEEKRQVAAQAKKLGLSESSYGYIKLFAPASSSIRTTDQKYAFGESGLALSSSQRIVEMVQSLAENLGPDDPATVELLQELAVLQRHTRCAYNYLLGDLRARKASQGE
jgi:hypothetical protein